MLSVASKTVLNQVLSVVPAICADRSDRLSKLLSAVGQSDIGIFPDWAKPLASIDKQTDCRWHPSNGVQSAMAQVSRRHSDRFCRQ